jgi:spore maturation protein CgeB
LRIMYVGELWQGSTSLQRYYALKNLENIVFPFDIGYYFPSQYRSIHTVQRKMGFGPRLWKMNKDIIRNAILFLPDVVWFDKALLISPETLHALKKINSNPFIIHFSPDDMFNPDNQSRYFMSSIGSYDLHVTGKSYNIPELKEVGAKDVFFMNKAYDPETHRPVILSPKEQKEYGADIGFIGTFEKERSESIKEIAKAGFNVRIWGPGWECKDAPQHTNILNEKRALWGDEYTKVICATKINLCFLRKVNRDKQTARSIEIPACGGFMLAERTDEHLALFEENKEAVFFSTNKELIDKIEYYLKHQDELARIALAGHKKCIEGKYSNKERMALLFSYLKKSIL